jgi:NADPH:quinone reductase-like Zn-dependent oxidoreductase
VIATAGSDEKLRKGKELGADETIHHGKQKILDEVKRLTNKRGVDVVFEHVGTAVWEQCVASLAPGGRLVTCGNTTGYDAKIDIRHLFSKHLSLLGSYMGSKAELYAVLKLIGERKLHAVIDRTMPLAECARAHELIEKREQFGKIVLNP